MIFHFFFFTRRGLDIKKFLPYDPPILRRDFSMYQNHDSVPKCHNIQVIRYFKKILTICIMTFNVSCRVFSTLKIFSILRGFGNNKFP